MNKKITNFAQIASLRRYTITDGRAKGLDVIDCDNGKIRFLLNVTKALDVMQLYHEGQNVSFLSKNAFTAREVDFLERFEGGMLYTCGLDSVGGREGFELHGKLHNTTAEIEIAKCDESGIVVEAVIRRTALFGQNLVLRRRVTSEIGSECVKLEDTLTNEGYSDADYCILYHINVGYPMLDEGAKVVADVNSVTPRDAWAAENEASAFEISDAVDGMAEQCFYLDLKSKKVSLVNEKSGKAFSVEFDGEILSEFVEWKSMASGDYVVGLEPASTKLDVDNFAYRTLKSGESTSTCVKLSVSAK